MKQNLEKYQAWTFSEERGLTPPLGQFGILNPKKCLQAEKWRLIELICVFSRWPPKIIHNITLLLIHCLMYLGVFVGFLCWCLFCYAFLCVLSIFDNT